MPILHAVNLSMVNNHITNMQSILTQIKIEMLTSPMEAASVWISKEMLNIINYYFSITEIRYDDLYCVNKQLLLTVCEDLERLIKTATLLTQADARIPETDINFFRTIKRFDDCFSCKLYTIFEDTSSDTTTDTENRKKRKELPSSRPQKPRRKKLTIKPATSPISSTSTSSSTPPPPPSPLDLSLSQQTTILGSRSGHTPRYFQNRRPDPATKAPPALSFVESLFRK